MKRIYQYIIMFMVGGMLVACGTDQEPIVEFETVPNINKETVYLDDWAGSSFQLLFASDNTLYFCEYSDVNYEQRFHAIASGATEAEAIPLVVENESGSDVSQLVSYMQEYGSGSRPGGFFWLDGRGHCLTSNAHYSFSPDTKTWIKEEEYVLNHFMGDNASNLVVMGDNVYQLTSQCLYSYSLVTCEWTYTYVSHNFSSNSNWTWNYLFAVDNVLYAFDHDEKVLYAYDASGNLWNEVYSFASYMYSCNFVVERDGEFYVSATVADDMSSHVAFWIYDVRSGQIRFAPVRDFYWGGGNNIPCFVGSDLYSGASGTGSFDIIHF